MWSIIAGAAVAVALAGMGVWVWRMSRQIVELRRDLADAAEAEQVVRRAKRNHLRRAKALWPFVALGAAGRQVRHHPVMAGAVSAAGATALLVSVAADYGPSDGGKETGPRAIEAIDLPDSEGGQRPDSGTAEDEPGDAEKPDEQQPVVADEPTLAAPAEDEPAAIGVEVVEPTEPEPEPVVDAGGVIGDDISTDVLTPEPPELPPAEVPPPTTEPPELSEPVSEPVDNDEPDETADCLIGKALGGKVAELELCLNPPGLS